MLSAKEIWVYPEITGKPEEVSKLSLGLLTEARTIAEKVNGKPIAILAGNAGESYRDILQHYGISGAYVFKNPLFQHISSELLAPALADQIRLEKPWLCLAGHTSTGKELVSLLTVALNTGVVANCVKTDLQNPAQPVFYRPTYGGQAYQEIVFQNEATKLVTIDPQVLNVIPKENPGEIKIKVFEPSLSGQVSRIKHLSYIPSDYQTVDIAEAEVIISAGAGAADKELLLMVKELAELLEGAIGTTRPVADEGIIGKDRMIGQTGKTVSPELYLALGISGATQHTGGIQEAGTIIAINRDPRAPIFQSSDTGAVADLKEILPVLIAKIKQTRTKSK